MKLLFLSTPVGPLGSGLGGGVELTLLNLAMAMLGRGYELHVVAPAGSVAAQLSILEVGGNLQLTAQTQQRTDPIVLPPDSVLAAMWDLARQKQTQYDLLVNFAYDWLPFYLTPFFKRPIAHLVSMGSLTDAMDAVITQVVEQFPGTIGMHSRAQAETFPFADRCRCLGNGFDLSAYQFCAQPSEAFAWVGRIAPEKGLEDAVLAAKRAAVPLQIFGVIQDEAYWQQINQDHPDAPITYQGFLPTVKLQQALGQCRALLMTPHWLEAFGNVAIEAMACGVPVIAYRRGGPAEIVQDGKTGWLVEPDHIAGLVTAIERIDQIDRLACRRHVEAVYSLAAMGDRVDAWFQDVIHHY
ncbi:MAG: glycosyltransferase family 4 protein [Scytolyngbya sp. HA4215-MV1]|nr:glycosyltransferase family 4 protein [Scytolyngbya sp. HA4215-MV1]